MKTAKTKQGAIRRKSGLVTALSYLLLSFWAVVVLFPFYWMLLTSLKSYASYNAERTPVFPAPLPHAGELRERLYRRAFGGLPVKHPDLLPGHHRGDGGGEHPGGLRLRPAPLPGEEPGVRGCFSP